MTVQGLVSGIEFQVCPMSTCLAAQNDLTALLVCTRFVQYLLLNYLIIHSVVLEGWNEA